MGTILVPRPHQGRRRAFIFEGSGDVNPWASDVDRTLTEVIKSLGQSQRLFSQLTNQTSAATGRVALHASTHLPNGTDPLTTVAPSGGYGTTAAKGVGNAFLRGDARFKYPPAIMDPNNTAALLFVFKDSNPGDTRISDSPTYPSLTGGTLFLDYTKVTVDVPNVASNVRVVVSGSPDLNQTLLQSSWLSASPAGSTTVACWDARYASLAGTISANTYVGYEMSSFGLNPSGGSGGSNIAYGARLRGPTIGTANGSWTEVAALNLLRAARSISNPTVTTGYIAKCEMPNLGTTDQIGFEISNVTDGFQHTPTNRRGIRVNDLVKGTALRVSYSAGGQSGGTPTDVYGFFQETAHSVGTNRYGARYTGATTGTPTKAVGVQVDAHSVGTNQWSFLGAQKFENTGTDFIASASGKGLVVMCSDDNTQFVRIRALYNGGSPSISLDAVGTTLPAS